MSTILFTLARSFALALCLSLVVSLQAEDKKAKPSPPTIDAAETELATLEELVAHWEKQLAGSTDAKQRASAYQQLLLRAGNLANQLNALRQLLNTATQSLPKQDATGGLTNAATAEQKRQLARISDAEARLRKLRDRIDALKSPAGGKIAPGGGGAGGGGKPPVVTPSAGDARKR